MDGYEYLITLGVSRVQAFIFNLLNSRFKDLYSSKMLRSNRADILKF